MYFSLWRSGWFWFFVLGIVVGVCSFEEKAIFEGRVEVGGETVLLGMEFGLLLEDFLDGFSLNGFV